MKSKQFIREVLRCNYLVLSQHTGGCVAAFLYHREAVAWVEGHDGTNGEFPHDFEIVEEE